MFLGQSANFCFASGWHWPSLRLRHEMVVVAQLVEPRIVIPVVAGSSPVVHPIFRIGVASDPEEGGGQPISAPMQSLEIRIHYKFRNSLLLAEALTHPSLAYESASPHFDNQRLEFLGDAILQLIVTEELYRMFPDFTEGRLTKLRARVVSRRALARFAMAIDLGRGITRSDRRFRSNSELYGLAANVDAHSLFRQEVGFIGMGDLGKLR